RPEREETPKAKSPKKPKEKAVAVAKP
ncbi:MAG: hypothetical protein JWR15_1718, partial [Prosthecobacter sp.]|nr:hypothetical protein [Prosthecobacter sp.]